MLKSADLDILNKYLPKSCQGIIKTSALKIASLKQSTPSITKINRSALSSCRRNLYEAIIRFDAFNGWRLTKRKPSIELDLQHATLDSLCGYPQTTHDADNTSITGGSGDLSKPAVKV